MPFLPSQLPGRAESLAVFYSTGSPQLYEIPDWASMVLITAIGAGGGGGSGFTAAAAAARGGGGGGGCGAISRAMIPALFLPRALYISPGAAGLPSGAGGNSFVGIANTSSNSNNILIANGGGAGGNGTGAAVGAAGAAGAVSTVLNGVISWHGVHTFNVGAAGAAGGAVAGGIGPNATWGNVTPGLSGGAGGGGTTSADFAGGGVNGSGPVPTVPNNAAGSNIGSPAYWDRSMMLMTGGGGGGASNAGVGGNGANGAPGCGGGGGGGGTTGGTGGSGGSGLIIIQAMR